MSHTHHKRGLGKRLSDVSMVLAMRLLDWSSEIDTGFDLGPCWIWQGHKDKDGYGEVKFRGYKYRACRVSYAAFVGVIPESLDIDHLCTTPACINPKHLTLETANKNRGELRHTRKTREVIPI